MAHGQSMVTFLFTDIEASTPQWEVDELGMAQAMQRHDAILAECVSAAGGKDHRLRGEGDSKFLVFSDPGAAVLAIVEILRRLEDEPWPGGVFIRVRAGIHSGTCRMVGGDFYGPEVNRAARLRSAAHGGQCLISGAARAALNHSIGSVDFLDLGKHRLKDLLEPMQVYQVMHPDLPSEFPPIQSLRSAVNNLPTQGSSFIGRENEMSTMNGLLSEARLVTIHGTGGVGKTRLSIQVAAVRSQDFPGGVWFVDLTRCVGADEFWIELSRVLGVRGVPGRPLDVAVRDRLASASSLLVLDNCEHVLPELAPMLRDLMQSVSDLRTIATSREPIGIPGERLLSLRPLSTESNSATPGLDSEAARLFIDRALALRSDFDFGPWNASTIHALCEGLDGLPLAIELVAEHALAFGIDDLLALLPGRLRSFEGAGRDSRHRTLEANIAWSFERLDNVDRTVAIALSVAESSFDLDAVRAIADVQPPEACLAAVNNLVRCAILVPDFDGPLTRYRFLPTLRAYARSISSNEDRIRSSLRYRDHFSRLGEKLCNDLEGDDAARALRSLDACESNVLAAIHMDAEDSLTTRRAQRLAALMFRYWDIKGRHTLAKQTYRDLLSCIPADEHSLELGLLHNSLGLAHLRMGEYDLAEAVLDRAVSLREANGDEAGAARSRFNLGTIRLIKGKHFEAQDAYESALVVLEPISGPVTRATIRMNLGLVALELGESEKAMELSQHALHELADTVGAGLRPCLQGNMAVALAQLGRHEEALARFEVAIRELDRDPNDREAARIMANFADTLRRSGKPFLAAEALSKALERYATGTDRRGTASALDVASAILATVGDAQSAWEVLLSADRIRAEIDAPRPARELEEYAQLRAALERVVRKEPRDVPCHDEQAIQRARTALDGIRGRSPSKRRS